MKNAYKVVVVDDEQNIREGLRKVIDWESYGFSICGEAADGEEGLALIERNGPDLVIVDIKMPGMNGIELIRELKKRENPCKTVILSGYSDFAYAQAAMELGAECYLLKPIDRFELCEKVKTLYNQLESEQAEKELFSKSFRISRDGILESLVSGDGDIALVTMANSKFAFRFPWNSYQIALISITDLEGADEFRHQALEEKMGAYAESSGLGLAFGTGADIAFLVRDRKLTSSPKYTAEIQRIAFEECGCGVCIAEGPVVSDMQDIYTSYLYAHKLLQRRFVLGTKGVISAEAAPLPGGAERGNGGVDIEAIGARLYLAIDMNQAAEICASLEEARAGFAGAAYSPLAIKTMYAYLYAGIVNKLLVHNDMLRGLFEFSEAEFQAIFRSADIWQLHDMMKGRFTAMAGELARARPDDKMERILDYIARNYSDDLKLESLARTFHYNSAYLGKLFKSHTGQYFNNYLDMIRMEEARKLLADGCRVYQVAEKIGYDNIRYFHAKFKKYTGKSPAEFRKCSK